MKRVFAVLLSVLCISFAFSSCSALKSMKKNADKVGYTVAPQPLEVHGGLVKVDVTANYPAKYFKKKIVLSSVPELRYAGNSATLKRASVQGEKVRGNYPVISTKGGQFKYTDQITYVDEMMNSQLYAPIIGAKGLATLKIDEVKLADGVIATSRLVKLSPRFIFAPDFYQQITEDAVEGQILYQINQSNVRNSELKGASMEQLRADMAAAKANERIEIKNAQVLAYASPDGAFDFNAKLADKRTSAGEKVFLKDLKAADIYDGSESGFLELLTTPEDWEGFKAMMEKSSIKDKELILRVLQMYQDPIVREREIKNIASAYEEIKDEILPQLRRSRLRLNLNIIGLSDEELLEIGAANPSVLKEEEVLHAAALYEGNNARQISILEAAVKSFPNNWRAKNNLAAAYAEAGRISEAENMINAAARIENNPTVSNNMACINILKGETTKAATNLAAASGASSKEYNYNQGLYNTIMGNYAEAISKFGNESDVNAALAKLLAKQNSAALALLNQLDGSDALVAYLKAVVGARTGDENLLFNNLSTAVRDSKLRANAKKDLEFANYMQSDKFKSIVK